MARKPDIRRPLFFLSTLFLALLLLGTRTTEAAPPQPGKIVKLPAPQQKGGLGVFDALNAGPTPGNRFPSKRVSPQDLSTILWAATGPVHADRVVGNAENGKALEGLYTIYVLGDDGVFVYDRKKNELREVSKNRIKSLKAPKSPGAFQAFAKSPHSLAFVVCHRPGGMEEDELFYLYLPPVLMQRVYLAAAALGVAATALPLGEESAEVFAYQTAYDIIKLENGEQLMTIMPLAKK